MLFTTEKKSIAWPSFETQIRQQLRDELHSTQYASRYTHHATPFHEEDTSEKTAACQKLIQWHRLQRWFTHLHKPNINKRKDIQHLIVLKQIIEVFKRHAIPFCVIKGIALNLQLYGHAVRRVSTDIDIWVPQEVFIQAGKQLESQGYTLRDGLYPEQIMSRSMLRSTIAVCHYLHPTSKVLIELHQHIAPLPHFFCFSDSPPRMIGFGIPTLTPEQTMLHLMVHGAYDEWCRLQHLMDIILLDAKHDLDWHAIRRMAHQFGANRILLETGELTQYWGYTLPITDQATPMDRFCLAFRRAIITRQWRVPKKCESGLCVMVMRLLMVSRWHAKWEMVRIRLLTGPWTQSLLGYLTRNQH